MHDIEQLIALESDIRYQEYASEAESEYLHILGIVPILISAPHGAAHTRNGDDKEEDEYTAGIARLVGLKSGAHVLYARRKSRTDPNADFAAPYKKNLLRIAREHNITFVLDIHGVHERRDFGVAVGSMGGRSCSEMEKQILLGAFERHGISEAGEGLARLDLDNHFPGAGDERRETVIGFCRKHAIPAVQIEIHARLRIPVRREDATRHEVAFQGEVGLIGNLVEALVKGVVGLGERGG